MSWNSQSLSRPVMGLLCLSSSYFCCTCINTYTGKILLIIIHMLVYSSFCSLNFMLPACGPKYVQVVLTTYKVDQAWFNDLHSTLRLLHASTTFTLPLSNACIHLLLHDSLQNLKVNFPLSLPKVEVLSSTLGRETTLCSVTLPLCYGEISVWQSLLVIMKFRYIQTVKYFKSIVIYI